jgi:hypothetical protein
MTPSALALDLDDITKLTRRAPTEFISKAKSLINVMLRNATCRMRACI